MTGPPGTTLPSLKSIPPKFYKNQKKKSKLA